MSERDDAAAYLANLVASPRVRDRAIKQILAHKFMGYGLLMLMVPNSVNQPVEIRTASASTVMQMTLFEAQDVEV